MLFLHDDVASMSRLLQTSETTYIALLELFGFAKVDKQGLVKFQANKFQTFMTTFSFLQTVCELMQHSVRGFKSQKWFIRVGSQNMKDICTAGTRGEVAPRIHFIERISRDLKDDTTRLARRLESAVHPHNHD